MAKKILVVARHKPLEALRVAAGLTLTDSELSVLAIGPLPEGEAAEVQLEALAFADITPEALAADAPDTWAHIAGAIVASDAVYLI